jgi:carbamoyl-phosphate synthase large subunit
MTTTTTVAVTGLHRGENPQPGAAVIRSLRRFTPNITIVGLSYDPLESSLYSQDGDHVDVAYSLPFPGQGPQALRERLLEILDTQSLDAIIPCLDSELENFIWIQEFLRQHHVGVILPSADALHARSKARLPAWCEENHVSHPKTVVASDVDTLAAHAEEIGYPLYVKGRLYEGRLVGSREELIRFGSDLITMWGGPILAQQAIVGEEFCVTGIGDGLGGLVGSCAIRKLLVTRAGKGFGGVVISDPDLDLLTARIIRGLTWNGPFELEFVKPLNGRHMIIEFNPRFPAWIDFPSQAGCNFAGSILEAAMRRRPHHRLECPVGKLFIRHSVDLIGDISQLATLVTTGQMSPGLSGHNSAALERYE